MEYLKFPKRFLRHAFVFPIIFSVIIPIIILDIWIEVYHRICFPFYGLPYSKRSSYIVFDRMRLSYLTWDQKMYCMYCSYGNGVIQYWAAIAGASEAYWCGIQHQKTRKFFAPPHHKNFVPYGDEKAWRDKYGA